MSSPAVHEREELAVDRRDLVAQAADDVVAQYTYTVDPCGHLARRRSARSTSGSARSRATPDRAGRRGSRGRRSRAGSSSGSRGPSRSPPTLRYTCQTPTGVLPVAPVEVGTIERHLAAAHDEQHLPRLVDLDVVAGVPRGRSARDEQPSPDGAVGDARAWQIRRASGTRAARRCRPRRRRRPAAPRSAVRRAVLRAPGRLGRGFPTARRGCTIGDGEASARRRPIPRPGVCATSTCAT